MLKIGIRAHDIGKSSLDILATKLENNHFNYIQLVLNKALINTDGYLTKDIASEYLKTLNQHHIKVCMLGAYFNPIHSDINKVEQGINKFKNHLMYANDLDCKYVGTETGSYNDDSWTFNINNQSETAYQKVYKIVNELVTYANDYDTDVAIEGAYAHVINTPERLKRLCDDINNDHMKVIIDLYNYLSIDNYKKQNDIFNKAITLLKKRIVIFHLKDYIVEDNHLKQVGLGQGLMDFPYMIKEIKANCPNAYLIFEGITGEDIQKSLSFIKKLL